jgi:hypothetical protein
VDVLSERFDEPEGLARFLSLMDANQLNQSFEALAVKFKLKHDVLPL